MRTDTKQMSLFGENELPRPPRPKSKSGGSQNPLVFRDYESFLNKFGEAPKTTDECYTPNDVYEAVVNYVASIVDLSDKVILRPFYPNGDYEHADYPENGVVIDNPPFSIFTKICQFYTVHKIPFFLFGAGLTIMSCCKYCTAVIVNEQITFHNGAKVKCNFASNLYGDLIAVTAPALNEALMACPSQNTKANLPKYEYPSNLLSVSDMQTMCRAGIEFMVRRSECEIVKTLDKHPKEGLFGDHLLLSDRKAREKDWAKARAKDYIRPETANIVIPLSKREQIMIQKLSAEE